MFGKKNLSADDKLARVKIKLQEEHPFWAYLIMKMIFSEDTKGELPMPTMGVNAKGHCKWSRKFIDKLSEEELKGVLAHEVNHLIFMHMIRCGIRHPMKFNLAADIIVNNILIENGFTLPKEGVIPYKNEITIPIDRLHNIEIKNISKKTAEEIYEELPVIKDKKGNGGGKSGKDEGKDYQDLQGWDNHIYDEDKLTQSEREELKKEWENNTIEAAVYSKKRGKVPKGMESLIEGILNPQLNWKQLLRKYIKNNLPYDCSFSRPNKKFLAHGIILPGEIKESIEVICHIDTSGSITEKELQTFMSECYSIANSHNNVRMTLIECDCQIQQIIDVTSKSKGKLSNVDIKGRGGTSHTPVIEWMKKNKPSARLLVSLTDGYSDIEECYPELKCKKLIILTKDACDEDRMKPYGEVIKLKV